MYYPNRWTNSEGRTFEAGYYDEDGNRYRNVAVENEETILTCEYCGTKTKVVWKEGAAPNCENCGAPLQIDVVDRPREKERSSGETERKSPFSPIQVIALVFVVFILASLVILAVSSMIADNIDGQPIVQQVEDTIYVEEIGRTCSLDGENYYDEVTNCWFWYNEDYQVWQYWYEDISSNYGDYGWMEYDYNENQWYVQDSRGDWIQLPDRYKLDYLWHFNE